MNTPAAAPSPLWELDATALTRGYADGRFTPSEALEAVHARIDEVNPAINAIVAEDRAAAGEAAKRSTLRWRERAQLSALDGVPFTVKDNIFAAGLPATWGSAAYKGFQPNEDEPAIARLRAAGAIIIGKTNVPEFTVQGYTSNALFGPTFNPLAHARSGRRLERAERTAVHSPERRPRRGAIDAVVAGPARRAFHREPVGDASRRRLGLSHRGFPPARRQVELKRSAGISLQEIFGVPRDWPETPGAATDPV
jgi:Amidase